MGGILYSPGGNWDPDTRTKQREDLGNEEERERERERERDV